MSLSLKIINESKNIQSEHSQTFSTNLIYRYYEQQALTVILSIYSVLKLGFLSWRSETV